VQGIDFLALIWEWGVGSSLALEQMQNCEWMHHQHVHVYTNRVPMLALASAYIVTCVNYFAP
jgi:hypothetical protein